jgi:hypothetical protein
MVMTYRGSERIGPQDYVELRGNGRTVRIVNETEYWAEAKHRILRKKKVNKIHSYEQMYREIRRQIVLNGAGDTAASVKGALEVGLWLEDRDERSRLALLWQILSSAGFPNQFFNDSWMVGFWRGRRWLAGRWIGKKSLDVGSSRFWIGWVIKRGDKCVRSTYRG